MRCFSHTFLYRPFKRFRKTVLETVKRRLKSSRLLVKHTQRMKSETKRDKWQRDNFFISLPVLSAVSQRKERWKLITWSKNNGRSRSQPSAEGKFPRWGLCHRPLLFIAEPFHLGSTLPLCPEPNPTFLQPLVYFSSCLLECPAPSPSSCCPPDISVTSCHGIPSEWIGVPVDSLRREGWLPHARKKAEPHHLTVHGIKVSIRIA